MYLALSLQKRRSESIKYASCCAALALNMPGTCRLKARTLPGTNFMPFDSESSNRESFFIFKADEETGEYAH